MESSNIIAAFALLVSIFSVYYSWQANDYADAANKIAKQQTQIAQQQTDILDRQTQIQNDALQFEQDKNRTDTAKEYREHINILYDKIYHDETFSAIYNKIKNGEKVQNINNLDRFVDAFENIGILFCDDRIKLADLKAIMKKTIEPVCGNAQIYNHYQNTKSGISGMCVKLFPGSSVMAKYADKNKCVILNQ